MARTTACVLAALVSLCTAVCGADFEAQPAPFRTVARPADGESLSVDPPCFVYPAAKVHDRYHIEASTDRDFARNVNRFVSRYMLFAPGKAFKPGKYYWRWRPDTPVDDEAPWSKVRSFTIVTGAAEVPFPDIHALVQQIGTSRPRIGVTADTLPELRKRARERFGDDWLDRVTKTADRLREKPLVPEPDFLPDEKDPRRAEAYQKSFQMMRPFMRDLAILAENYLLTGDEPSGQEAKRRLLHIVGWSPQGSTSLENNDDAASEILRTCATALDRIHSLLNAEEKKRCIDCLTTRMSQMRDRWRRRPFEMYPYESHNMGSYLPDLLEASLALVGEAPVEEMLHYTMLQLWSPFYPPYGGSDGGWSEGPSYWNWNAQVFARMYRTVHTATGVPIELRSNLRNASLFKLYTNPPYFKMSPFGDGHEEPAGGRWTMSMLAALYADPHAKWYSEQQGPRTRPRHRLDSLLFDADEVQAKSPSTLPQGRAFFDVGVAAMHSALADPANNVALLMRSCPFGSISHGHADQNTFALDAYGEPLIIASGYYQLYGHPHHARWTRQTKASNSVLVDGHGQHSGDWNAKGRVDAFESQASGDYVVGDASEAYGDHLDRFVRRVVFLRPAHTGGEPVIVIRDELSAPRPSTFQFLLHAVNKMDVDAGAQRVIIGNGTSRCRVDYVAPQGLLFDQQDQFPVAPYRPKPNQWHLMASTKQPSTIANLLTVIQPYRQGDANKVLTATAESHGHYAGVRLSNSNRTLVVLFESADNAEKNATGPFATAAAAASFRIVDGRVEAVVEFGSRQPNR